MGGAAVAIRSDSLPICTDLFRVIAVANRKGGVAKTTTVHTVAEALEDLGKRALMVDLDPQACLTYATGIDPEALDSTVHDVFMGRTTLGAV